MGSHNIFDNDFYIISDDFRLLDFNDSVKARYEGIKLGDFCYKARLNRDTPCKHCPILDNTLHNAPIFFDFVYGDWIQAIFSRLDEKRYAVTCRPVQGHGRESFQRIKDEDKTCGMSGGIISDGSVRKPIEDYDIEKIGIIGGYCEDGFPLYYVNQRMLELLGYESCEELELATSGLFNNLVYPQDLPERIEELGDEYYEGMKYETSYRMTKKDGSIMWVIDRGEIICDADGRLVMMCICLDVTRIREDHIKRENELRTAALNAKLWADITRMLYGYNLIVDIDTGTYTTIPGCGMDKSVEFLKAHDDYDEIFRRFCNNTDPAFRSRAQELLSRENLRAKRDQLGFVGTGEFLVHFPDGSSAWQEMNVFIGIDKNGKSVFHILCRDMTQAHDNEQMKQTIKINKIFLNAMPPDFVACAIVNLTDGTQIRLLRQGSEIVEARVPYLWDDFLRDVINAHMTEPDQIEYMQQVGRLDMLRKKKPGDVMTFNYYTSYQSPDGKPQPVSTTLTFFEQDGLAYMTIFTTGNIKIEYEKKLNEEVERLRQHDIKQRAALEEALEAARSANAAKSSFLSRMSHDMRTPLNGIVGLLKLSENHFDNQEMVRENHKKMQVSAEHLLSLINDVLQMSKIEDGDITLTHEIIDCMNLSKEIVTIIENRAADYAVKMVYDKENSAPVVCPYVYGSPVHLRQIFLNIYGNCIKYNHRGGSIITAMKAVKMTDEICTYRWNIKDTGIGMNEKFIERIFEPFAQEKQDARSVYNGTGLGMSIVKGLIDKMGGSITVKSKEGEGSEFEITIPFEIAPQPPEESNSISVENTDITGVKLMLVEDNELNADIACMLLKDRGAQVTVATDGREAVELFEKEPAGTFDLILMDIMMPVMNGIEATKAIRSIRREDARDIPVIAMTANAFKEDENNCLEAGMNAHLGKPIDIEKLVRLICEYKVKRQEA